MTIKVSKNPDKSIVNSIISKLKENGGYCPCQILHTPDTKCICKQFREQIEKGEPGECHCGLYRIDNI